MTEKTLDPLAKLLQEVFGYTDFREGQRETIESVLRNKRTLAILPTSSGKSLCYQLASYLLPGQTIIVTPLISLMEDQVSRLRQLGEKRVTAIHSQMSFQTRQRIFCQFQQYKFVFVSPELLVQDWFKEQAKKGKISLVVVDEAHCISQWGIDFRPDYEWIPEFLKELDSSVKVLGLTATATQKVMEDIESTLFHQQACHLIKQSSDRQNIAYQVVETEDKTAYLKQFLSQHPGPGIIYFSSKKEAERICTLLQEETELAVSYYHGDLSNQERLVVQQQFLHQQLHVLCATSAFGMGIHKEDVRFVIHYHLPSSVEAYVQEAGRSGRDGKQSLALLLYRPQDEHIHYHLLEQLIKEKEGMAYLLKQPEETWQQYLPKLSSLQQKWLTGYTHQRYSKETLMAGLEQKISERTRHIQDMLTYIHLTTCRRKYLLAYFDSESEGQVSICCDHCGLEDLELETVPVFPRSPLEFSKDWQETLKKVFNQRE